MSIGGEISLTIKEAISRNASLAGPLSNATGRPLSPPVDTAVSRGIEPKTPSGNASKIMVDFIFKNDWRKEKTTLKWAFGKKEEVQRFLMMKINKDLSASKIIGINEIADCLEGKTNIFKEFCIFI